VWNYGWFKMVETQLDRIENMLKYLTLQADLKNTQQVIDDKNLTTRIKTYDKKPVG